MPLQRLPTNLYPLVLRKEYFDCPAPEGDSYAVHYILRNRGGGEAVLSYSLGCSKLSQLLLYKYNADSPFVMSAGITVVD
jgi:hypothetical protein